MPWNVKLNVPHIVQERQNSCWHASARMLIAYKQNVSTHPLENIYDNDVGLDAGEFIELAREVGLDTLPQVNQTFSREFLRDRLNSYGPIWAAGQWNGANHIIVITGVDSADNVYINDPAFQTPKKRNMAWFNARIDKNVDNPMMYLP